MCCLCMIEETVRSSLFRGLNTMLENVLLCFELKDMVGHTFYLIPTITKSFTAPCPTLAIALTLLIEQIFPLRGKNIFF